MKTNMITRPKLTGLLALALGLAASSARAADPIVLFNGTSVAGWHQAGPGNFELHDGMITAHGGMGLLWNDRVFTNFIAHVEFKTEKHEDNSGVFVRFPDPGNDPWVAVNKGHEIQICETEEHNRTGAIYNFQDSSSLPIKPLGEWNTMDIKVVGRAYTVTLNGKVVNEFVSPRSLKGMIGLQNHWGAVSFRKVTVEELPDDAKATVAAAPEPVRDPAPGLVGRYFDDTHSFRGLDKITRDPFFFRVDPQVNFPLVSGDFYGSHLSEDFAIVWTGSLHVDVPGDYLFDLPSDDGARLKIGDKLVLDNTAHNVPMKDKYGDVVFPAAGDYPVRIEYHQNAEKAGVILKWQSPTGKMDVIPASAFSHEKSAETVKWDQDKWKLASQDPIAYRKKYGTKYEKMDYGPFLGGTFEAPSPKGNVTDKGIIISLNKEHTVNVLFDTETMRYSAGWTGDYIDFNGVAYNGSHGVIPKIKGTQIFGTAVGPGWDVNGSWADPRKDGFGNIDGLKWRGLYRSGDQVVLSYAVKGVGVLDLPGFAKDGESLNFSRTLQIEPSKTPLKLLLDQDAQVEKMNVNASVLPGVKISKDGDKFFVTFAPHDAAQQITLGIESAKDGTKTYTVAASTVDLVGLLKGGRGLWGDPIVTQGHLGDTSGPYVVDTITAPETNPADAWLRFSGFDFFPDGHSAAICTWNGDVWIVKGIDDKLDHLTWQRYATGLFQSLGLKIVNGEIYVLGRDQITHLHDLNGDGEADFYENFNNDCLVSSGFHEFQHDLQVDSQGNFYYAKGGPVSPGGRGFQKLTDDAGCIMKVSADGKHSEVYATGLRAPNGMSMGPHDEITVSDNQGTWTPACRISFVTKGSFLGVPSTSHLTPEPTNYGNPICWFPYIDGDYTQGDNSSGGAAWDITNKWGPLDGHMIHLSYGTCSIFETMYEKVGDIWQGGVVRFPLDFDSGIMRARFSPVDGQLYVCGLKGWQTRAAKDGIFQRVRYTGKTVNMPTEMHVQKDGIAVTFTNPVDPSIATDSDNYSIEDWNYIWSDDYGSPDVSRDNPKKKGHDTVDIDSLTLSPDKKTLTIKIADLKPVMQMKIIMKIKAADGSPMNWEIDNTVNVVPGQKSIATAQPQ